MAIPSRRRFASELQFDEGVRVGPYQIVRRIAPSCYDAETLASGLPVRIDLAGDEDTALIDVRFSRARSQLELVEHPCIARIVDHGVLCNGRPWVATARPPGTPLSDVLAERRLLPHETLALVHSTARVLAHAHARQVVHGSLRPHHLTLSKGAKVSILGWAWLRTAGIPAFGDPTATSVFNAPEHDGQSAIDGRSDVYALGAIAYRALTGVFPDVARDLLDPRDPLCAAIESMLCSDVRHRASAASIVADLQPLREQRRLARASEQVIEPVTDAANVPTTRLESIDQRTELSPPLEIDDLEERCTNRMPSQSELDATDTRVDVVS